MINSTSNKQVKRVINLRDKADVYKRQALNGLVDLQIKRGIRRWFTKQSENWYVTG